MTTPAASNLAHARSDEVYDSDDARPKDSPPLRPYRPKLEPSPTPPPEQPLTVSSPPSPGKKKSNRGFKKNKRTQADAVLLRMTGATEDVASHAFRQPLPSDTEESSGSSDSDISSIGGECSLEDKLHQVVGKTQIQGGGKARAGAGDPWRARLSSEGPSSSGDMGAFDLKSLAAGALAFANPNAPPELHVDAGPTPPVTEHDVVKERPRPGPIPAAITTTRPEPVQDPRELTALSPYSPPSIPPSLYSPRETGSSLGLQRSPTSRLPSSSHSEGQGQGQGLPPIQIHSPRSETNGPTQLPPIRAHLGDFTQIVNNHHKATESDRLRSHNGFPVSPPNHLPRIPSIHGHHTSPPISPAETFRRDPLSPSQSIGSATSPGYYYPQANGLYRPPDYASSTTETPGSDQSGSTPATSIADRMSIDGLTTQATYVCNFAGCTAQPFQTQYLLNSHMNVHSSARPHYCPVQGCPRSEGGKGFKRKNEMIRHGLVHDSPGYVCPFCPDREHKYPRPDNLQRYVALWLKSAILSFWECS